jgi:hypothetical protein
VLSLVGEGLEGEVTVELTGSILLFPRRERRALMTSILSISFAAPYATLPPEWVPWLPALVLLLRTAGLGVVIVLNRVCTAFIMVALLPCGTGGSGALR